MNEAPDSAPRGQPDVSIVIVHYETPALLLECLAAIERSDPPVSREVIVVDNGSSEFSGAAVVKVSPAATVIENDRNHGFAFASNQGVRATSGRYVLLLNPDTVVEPATLHAMTEYLDQNPDVGCATARLVLPDGRLDLACRRSFPTPTRALYRVTLLSRLFPRSRRFGQYNLGYLDPLQEAEIDSPCGAFMMVRREVIDQVGLLDESYFMYGEDLDWAYRIKQAGWRIMYTPRTTVLHAKRASSRLAREKAVRYFHDAMRIFYRRHYESRYPRLVTWLVLAAIRAREIAELSSVRLRAPQGAGR